MTAVKAQIGVMGKKDFLESKLGKLVISLPQNSHKQLLKWLEMPLRSYPKKLYQLLQIILKHAPNFESKSLNKDRLYKRLYPGKPVNIGTIKNLFTELITAIEDYLIYAQLQESKINRDQLLIKAYRNLGQNEKATELLTNNINELENSKVEDPDDSFVLSGYLFQYYDLVRNKGNRIQLNLILKKSLHSLNKAYALLLSRQLMAIQHREKLYSEKYAVEIDQTRLTGLNEVVDSPLLKLYQSFISTEVPNAEVSIKLFQQYKNDFEQFNQTDQRYLYYLILNDYRFLFEEKEELAASQFLEIYQFGLMKGFLFLHKKMLIITYTNVVVVSNLAGEFDYTRQFIKDYTQYLSKAIQMEARLYAESHLLFKQGEFHACVETCATYKFNASNLSIKIQLTLLQAYFDLFLEDRNYFELLENFSFAYEKRVRRNPNYRTSKKERYIKSILFVRKIAKAILRSDKKALFKLFEEVEASIGLQGFLWWREKIVEVKQLLD